MSFRWNFSIICFFRSKFQKDILVFEYKNSSNQKILYSQDERSTLLADEKWKTQSFLSKFYQVHPVRNVFFRWNHDFQAPSAEICAKVYVIEILQAPSGKDTYVYGEFIQNLEKFESKTSVQTIFFSPTLFSPNWNHSSEHVLWLLRLVLKQF